LGQSASRPVHPLVGGPGASRARGLNVGAPNGRHKTLVAFGGKWRGYPRRDHRPVVRVRNWEWIVKLWRWRNDRAQPVIGDAGEFADVLGRKLPWGLAQQPYEAAAIHDRDPLRRGAEQVPAGPIDTQDRLNLQMPAFKLVGQGDRDGNGIAPGIVRSVLSQISGSRSRLH